MEIDLTDNDAAAASTTNSTVNNGASTDDFDQSLLQQFNTLNTTDREDLIRQLQLLFDSRLSESAAVFYLDMNNWNLQAAICSFLDVDGTGTHLPSMSFVKDNTINRVDVLEPNKCFDRVFQLFNNGVEAWPNGCHLKYFSGTDLSLYSTVDVPSVNPGGYADVMIRCMSPSDYGTHTCAWRLFTTDGYRFGDEIRATISVQHSTNELIDYFSNIRVPETNENWDLEQNDDHTMS